MSPISLQALRDLALWVEQGITPPASTQYSVKSGQVIVPSTASERRGIQPTVALSVAGHDRVEVYSGELVTFSANIHVPPKTGTITAVRWDLDGSHEFSTQSQIEADVSNMTVTVQHRYDHPGTYFPAVRVESQREGNVENPYTKIPNLGRMRVVVLP